MASYEVHSPDGTLKVTVRLKQGALTYSVEKNGTLMIAPSPLGAVLSGVDLTEGLSVTGAEWGRIDETYTIPAYKKASCRDHCRTLTLHLAGENGYPFTLEVRVYSDGVAFRQKFEKEETLIREVGSFHLPDSTKNVYCSKFRFSYEDEYNPVPLEDLHQNFWNFPVLIESGKDVWGLITEAAVFGDYGGSMLSSRQEDPAVLLVTAPPDEFGQLQLPAATPWRVILAGTLDRIVNSNTLENLNPPCEVEDTSFIKPGMVAWSWMTENDSPRDTQRQKDFIDFASEMHWPYVLVDGGWKEAGVDIPGLVEYGRPKGVGIWVWEHRRPLQDPEVADKTFALWKSWGVVGVKIDFFESDTRERMATMDMLAQMTAKHQLMVNFHGCTKPAGEKRRWPHIMTREGVMGGENFQNYSTQYWVMPTARHNCTLPFTRNAAGPMDYTPVTYRTYRTGTTDTHQTALPLIFTSYITHVGESPDPVLENPCAEFLKGLPTAWDESRLLEGAPASYVTMARRSGENWYVAGICACRGRTAKVDLSFLGEGEYEALIFQDDMSDLRYVDVPIGAKEPTSKEQYDKWEEIISRPTSHHHDLTLSIRTVRRVNRDMTLEIPCVQDGGFVIKLTKQ